MSGLTGNVADVNVTLNGLTHTSPNDIDILLVGPAGQNLVIMSDTGGGDVSNLTFTLDDEAAAGLGQPLTAGSFRPADRDPSGAAPDNFAARLRSRRQPSSCPPSTARTPTVSGTCTWSTTPAATSGR